MVNRCGKTLVVTGEPGLSNVRRDASRTDRCRQTSDIDLVVSCKRGKGQSQGDQNHRKRLHAIALALSVAGYSIATPRAV